MAEPVIRVEGLTKRFGRVRAVDGIDFTVAGGQTVGLLGGNGAGKTTTIGILLGLILPDSGRVQVLGEDVLRHRFRVLPRMNFSSPYVEVPRRLSVRESLTVYGHLYGLDDIAGRITALAEDLDLGPLLKRKVGTLSAGQKTRVALAKALLNAPELLLLDEPTASLDPDVADYVRGYLRRYQQASGATILLASHNMAEVERLCADVIMLKAGRVIDQDAPRALLDRYGRATLEEVFLDIARDRPRPVAAAGGA